MSNALRQRLLGVIRNPIALNMNFVAPPIHVRGSGLWGVSTLIETKKMGVRVGPLPPGVNAEYNRRHNEFLFASASYGSAYAEQMVMFHECVHAMTDLENTKARVVEDEAAAYIAGAIYLRRLLGGRSPQYAYGIRLEPQEAAADQIAENMLNLGNVWAVPVGELLRLQELILKHPAYSHVKRASPLAFGGI